ncbi:MAG: hypothetical protein JXA57_07110 [Armatimonadetes bacterium]|nr:hypothetical protein [Armatimonadota bacterium]
MSRIGIGGAEMPSRKSRKQKKAAPKGKAKAGSSKGVDLTALKEAAAKAAEQMKEAKSEAGALRAKAQEVEAAAKKRYAEALAPYRDACRRAGTECELGGIKAPPVAPRVRFLVERVKGGVKTSIKGRPETEEVVPEGQLKDSVGRAAKAYCERHLGGVDTQGAKFAGLGNRFRAVLAKK